MFSRLENWLFLKTFCFLFYYCKDNTKIPIYVLKHSINPLYLLLMCILSYGLVYVKKYNCKNVTYNLTGKCSLTNVADLLKSC